MTVVVEIDDGKRSAQDQMVLVVPVAVAVGPVLVDEHAAQSPEQEYDDQRVVLAHRPVGPEQLQGQALHGRGFVLSSFG